MMAGVAGVVLAHQGGWDEILVFAIPVLIYVVLRLWDRRREKKDGGE